MKTLFLSKALYNQAEDIFNSTCMMCSAGMPHDRWVEFHGKVSASLKKAVKNGDIEIYSDSVGGAKMGLQVYNLDAFFTFHVHAISKALLGFQDLYPIVFFHAEEACRVNEKCLLSGMVTLAGAYARKSPFNFFKEDEFFSKIRRSSFFSHILINKEGMES